MRAETLFVKFEAAVAMAALLLGISWKTLRIRITLGEVFGERHYRCGCLPLRRRSQRQHLALGQVGEILLTAGLDL